MALIEYKKAGLKYTVVETLQAGIELTGAEVKAVRETAWVIHRRAIKFAQAVRLAKR